MDCIVLNAVYPFSMLFTHAIVTNMAVDDHQVSQGEFRAELLRKQGCYVREESEAMEKVARTVARYFRPWQR